MYAKLAWRNMRRSVRDYGIYFVTLVFAVAMFYVFNTMGDQPAFLSMRDGTRRMVEGAVVMLEWLTVIMTGLVAVLVFYANRVIVRKRSRELGLYMLLGMEQGRLAGLLVAEVAVIGGVALVAGLVGGVFLSQLFALVVNKLLAAGLQRQPFVFSAAATGRTVIWYGLTFVLVGLWQGASVYRQRLLDLLTGMRRNEVLRLRSRPLSLLAATIGTGAIAFAYWLADQVSRDPFVNTRDPRILRGALLGLVGTYLLIIGLAGWFAAARRRLRSGRGLSVFLYRQLTSKINTHAGMLATIALMLTLTICIMSFGLALGRGQSERADMIAPFDYLFYSSDPSETFPEVLALFDDYGVAKYVAVPFTTGLPDFQGRALLLPGDIAWFDQTGTGQIVLDATPQVIGASAYADLRALRGYRQVELPAGRFLIHTSPEQTPHEERARDAYARYVETAPTLTVAGQALQPAPTGVLTELLGDELTRLSALLVVPDEIAAALPGMFSYMVIDVPHSAPAELDEALHRIVWDRPGHYVHAMVRAEYVGSAFATEGMLVFIASYIGLMFIVVSATLLALQQVTDAVEHRRRFAVLQKLGADDRMIDGAIARQLGLYFVTPLALAAAHSMAAIAALARLFLLGGGYQTVWPAAATTLAVFAVIYGAYYGLSLQSCRALFRAPQPR